MAGRQIVDGVLFANEIVSYTKQKKAKLFCFKMDFEKAFDSVNWGFLRDVMVQMDFGNRWCKWISFCLTISLLIDGSPTSEFKNGKGSQAR